MSGLQPFAEMRCLFPAPRGPVLHQRRNSCLQKLGQGVPAQHSGEDGQGPQQEPGTPACHSRIEATSTRWMDSARLATVSCIWAIRSSCWSSCRWIASTRAYRRSSSFAVDRLRLVRRQPADRRASLHPRCGRISASEW